MILVHKPKYVFLITVDCLRADALGCIGGGNLTPNIDKLAKEGLLFRRAFANGPGTNQSFPGILTSTYFLMQNGLRLSPRYTTLAEVVRMHRFKTVGFHSNPFLSKALGWDRGFEEFYDFMKDIKSPSAAVTRKGAVKKAVKAFTQGTKIGYNKRVQRFLKRMYYWFVDYQMPYIEAEKLNGYVFNWIRKNKHHRFFLWMHYMDPHYPFIPPERYLTNFSTRKEAFMFNATVDTSNLPRDHVRMLKELYNGEVKYVDQCIGKLFIFLEEIGVLENSLILVLGDHGNAFMEHQIFGHDPEILYNEVIHTPLLIHGLSIKATVDTSTQLLDVPPTILEILGIKKPKSFLGKSLIPIVNKVADIRPIFSESAKPDLLNLRYDIRKKAISCILGEWKLIVNELHRKVELYNIHRDINEKNNLVNEQKEVAENLQSLIGKHLQQERAWRIPSRHH